MMPESLCQVTGVQRWPRVQPRFQDSRERPRTQRTRRAKLAGRLWRGFRVRVRWRAVVAMRAMMVRRETVRSCVSRLARGFAMVERRGKGKAMAYEDEGPGYVVFFFMEVMDEEDEHAGDDDGGEQLAESQ